MSVIVQVADLVSDLPTITISDSSKPSTTDVQGFIDEIENEVEAIWIGSGCVWPPTNIEFAKFTVLLGARWRVLDVKFSLASAAMTPDAATQARLAYNDRLKRIAQVCVGASEADASVSTGPIVGELVGVRPVSGSDLGEWTERRDRSLRRLFRPYGWNPFGW